MAISRSSRAEEIEEYITEKLTLNHWKAGDRIDDKALADELGVSRNSVREALERLVAIKALTKKQWTGFFVPEMDPEFALSTLEVRIVLEKLALRSFLKNPNPKAIEEIEAAIKLSEEDLMQNDFEKFELDDYKIHEIIQNYCGNVWLPFLLKQTRYTIFLLRSFDRGQNAYEYAQRSINEHKEMLMLIKDNNKKAAVDNLEKQLAIQVDRIMNLIDPEFKTRK